MTESANHSKRAAEMNRRLEQLATDGEWQQVAEAMKSRDALLARIPAAEREAVFLAARQSTERLQALAVSAKSQCANELSTLKRGRQATASYSANR